MMKYMASTMLTDAQLIASIFGSEMSGAECLQLVNMFVNEQHGPLPTAEAQTQIDRVNNALELARRIRLARKNRAIKQVNTPEDVVRLMATVLKGDEQRELFHVVCLDTKNHVKEVFEVSVGSLNASIVHPRELFKRAVELSAASVVVTHNHPSGDPTPSGADIQLTRRLVKAGDILGIEVLDHVVTGGGDAFCSMSESSLM